MQKRENQKTILGYEDAYLKLKSVTHVSDIKVNNNFDYLKLIYTMI